jgi:hypothetical protein
MDAVLDPQEPKFNGDTTYHDDFRKWNIPKKYVHFSRDSGTSGPFAGATTYQTDFKGQPIAQKCPVFDSWQTYIYLWKSYVLLDVKDMFICRHSSFNTSDNNVVILFIKWVV